jgi:hypothetical protein
MILRASLVATGRHCRLSGDTCAGLPLITHASSGLASGRARRFARRDDGKSSGMSRLRRPRSCALAALATAFVIYLVAGHAYHPGQTMDKAAMGAGICIVLVTGAAVALLRPPPPRAARLELERVEAPSTPPPPLPPPARARASPVWLQRFLN